MAALEEMDAEEMARVFPILVRFVLNLGLRTRQQEAVTLVTIFEAEADDFAMNRAR